MSATRRTCTGSASALLVAVCLSIGSTPARADGDAALRWIDTGDCKRAADAINEGMAHDDARSFMLAGYLYDATGCVDEDLPRAARLYRRAVELGDREARNFLGLMHGLGRGVPQDYAAAYRWYTYGNPPKSDPTPAKQVAYGYAMTVNQMARSRVRYPRFADRQEGTMFVLFDTGSGTTTFSRESKGGAQARQHLERSAPFIEAVAAAYEAAVAEAPKPSGLADDHVWFETPWTFQVR